MTTAPREGALIAFTLLRRTTMRIRLVLGAARTRRCLVGFDNLRENPGSNRRVVDAHVPGGVVVATRATVPDDRDSNSNQLCLMARNKPR